MQFVRIADHDEIHFCAVDEAGQLHKLNVGADAPADFLALHDRAQAAGETTSAHARALLEAGPTMPWTMAEVDVAPQPTTPHLVVPYVPPEVWGAAFTYLRAGESNDDPYARERQAERPVVFFKATPPRYVGPNGAVGSRGDCRMMIPEPELGLVLSAAGAIIGYTIVNDVSSRDLPRENPLFVTYSKIFERCVSFGPVVVPVEDVPDAASLPVTCRVYRGSETLWDETGNTSRMYRTFAELIGATTAHNPLPHGTLLATGTAMSPPAGMHIVEGDRLEVEIAGLGCLRNPVIFV